MSDLTTAPDVMEVNLWQRERIRELEEKIHRLREALAEIRNDGTYEQPFYHFWSLADKALKESE